MSIGQKLALIFVVVIAVAIAIILAYISEKSVNKQVAHVEQTSLALVRLSTELKINVLELRQHEIRFTSNGDERYLAAHSKTLQRGITLIDDMARESENIVDLDADLLSTGVLAITKLREALLDYGDFFGTVANNRLSIGFDRSKGINAKLTQSLISLEDSVFTAGRGDPALVVSVLNLRQAQTEYLVGDARQRQAALSTIKVELDQFHQVINSTTDLTLSTQQTLAGKIADYQGWWPKVQALFTETDNSTKIFTESINRIEPLLNQVVEFAEQSRIANQSASASKRAAASFIFYLVLAGAAVAVCAASAHFAFNILKRLSSLLQASQALTKGDLTQDVQHTDWDDQLGLLARHMALMTLSLGKTFNKIRKTATQVAVASGQVMNGNTELSSRTQEQASSLEEIAASMEQMTGTVDTNAENATRAAELAKAATEVASAGNEVSTKTIAAMDRIETSNARINEMLELIQDIAFQTNLLALNAAVEAARAGEHGRGFSVVASEVRNLAGRSAKASKEMRALIDEGVANIAEGIQLTNNSGDMLRQIVSSSSDVSSLVNEIAAASQEQSSGIQQVNRSVVEMDNITQQNAALVEEAAAASESTSTQAQQLQEMVSFFQLKDMKKRKGGTTPQAADSVPTITSTTTRGAKTESYIEETKTQAKSEGLDAKESSYKTTAKPSSSAVDETSPENPAPENPAPKNPRPDDDDWEQF
ncbi:MAG: hypothetical protein KBT63_05180 [Porticoccaceae bacterium]|nr:hypothetical protein [Porticoccaceae bacterium]